MARQMPSKVQQARVGNYQAPVDMQGMDPEMGEVFKTRKDNRTAKFKMPDLRGAVSKIGQGIGRLMGNRESTPAEEQSYKLRGQKAYYEGKLKKP